MLLGGAASDECPEVDLDKHNNVFAAAKNAMRRLITPFIGTYGTITGTITDTFLCPYA